MESKSVIAAILLLAVVASQFIDEIPTAPAIYAFDPVLLPPVEIVGRKLADEQTEIPYSDQSVSFASASITGGQTDSSWSPVGWPEPIVTGYRALPRDHRRWPVRA